MCKRWDKSRGLWVKLQETNYSVFLGFLEDPALSIQMDVMTFLIDAMAAD
jgi:hypothetical protein